MKIVHTSDWHLGHQLDVHSREYEHECFLAWLLDRLDEVDADALLICGDVYDHANPSAVSQKMLFRFLADLVVRRPRHFQTVIIGGNHDSAIRLDAPVPLLDAMRVHVVGGLPRQGKQLDLERLTIPLKQSDDSVAAICAAMPFLRLADLPGGFDETQVDPMIEGVRELYRELLDHAHNAREPGQALIATGHCYMVGSQISELSERRILGGNQHALPVDIFPEWVDYAALGHIHKAQHIGQRENVRYCGSPIPLSVGENTYKHQVVLCHIDASGSATPEPIYVPRFVEILRLGPLLTDHLEMELASLPEPSEEVPECRWPFLELTIQKDRPEPGLDRRIQQALQGKAVRLLPKKFVRKGSAESLSDAVGLKTLEELTPEEVFEKCYRRSFDKDLPEDMRVAFASLLDEVGSAP